MGPFFLYIFLSCTSSGVSVLICVLLFRGVTSFESIGLPHFRRILDSFANFPSRTLIHAGALAVGIGLPRFKRILDSFANCPLGTLICVEVLAAGIGLPHFKRILDSSANCPSGTLICAGALAAEIKRRKNNFGPKRKNLFRTYSQQFNMKPL